MDIVSKNQKISIAYALKDTNGRVIEEVLESRPLTYLHGFRNIIPGLEEALEGKSVGERFTVTVKYEKGYGPYRNDLIIEIPKSDLKNIGEIWVGMEIETDPDETDFQDFQIPEDPRDIYSKDDTEEIASPYIIKEIRPETVLLDGNHPFAGMDLTFDVSVLGVEEPSPTELEMGFTEEEFDSGFDSDDDDFGDDHFRRFWH